MRSDYLFTNSLPECVFVPITIMAVPSASSCLLLISLRVPVVTLKIYFSIPKMFIDKSLAILI